MAGRFLSRCALWPTGYCLHILGFILVSIDRFSEDKVKFERISSWIGRLLAYKWME